MKAIQKLIVWAMAFLTSVAFPAFAEGRSAACAFHGAADTGDTLPNVEITTAPAAAIQRHAWLPGVHIGVRTAGGAAVYASGSAEIKGRGHATWQKEKKPYVFRLPQAVPLLDMPAHTEWVLLANVMDHSCMRNALAFEIARQTSLDWTPQGRFVRLVLNGDDRGLYYLCESLSVSPARLTPDHCAVLIECDSHLEGGVAVTLAGGGHPKDWRSVVRPRSLRTDTLSLVDWLIVNELTMNAETYGPRSCYLHVTPEGVLKAGPVWDYDLAFNHVGIDTDGNLRPTRLQGKMDSVAWLGTDASFCVASGYVEKLRGLGFPVPSRKELKRLIARRWLQLRPRMRRLTAFIKQTDRQIHRAAANDQRRWNGADPARFDPSRSYHDAVQRLRRTYRNRLEQMDKLFGKSSFEQNSL